MAHQQSGPGPQAEREVGSATPTAPAAHTTEPAFEGPFFQFASDLLASLDREGHFGAANPRWHALLGHAPDALRGSSLLALLHPEDREGFAAGLAQLGDASAPVTIPATIEGRCRGADGAYHRLRFTLALDAARDRVCVIAAPLPAADEAPAATEVQPLVPAQAQAAGPGAEPAATQAAGPDEVAALRERVALLECVIGSLKTGIYVLKLDDITDDLSLQTLVANSAAGQFTGVRSELVVGRALSDAFPGMGQSELQRIYANVARTGVEYSIGEVQYGDELVRHSTFTVLCTPLLPQHMMLQFENITERTRPADAAPRRVRSARPESPCRSRGPCGNAARRGTTRGARVKRIHS